jgi:hypothetical protein
MPTGPSERQLLDELWRISWALAHGIGLDKRPWVAVRIGPTSVALLTETANRPLPRTAAVEFAREATITTAWKPAAASASQRTRAASRD